MKSLFENFRRWSTLDRTQLLIEGILDDVKKKYPDINADVITTLSNKDPSGRNKYLMWMANQLYTRLVVMAKEAAATVAPQDIPIYGDTLGTPAMFRRRYRIHYSAAKEIIREIKKFHENRQRIKNTDLGSYKTLEDLKKVNRDLGFTDKQKRKKKREAARAGSSIIFQNDDFFMVRPTTQKASCYYGRGAPWCISRQGSNYFHQYTKEGKAFYMILLRNLDAHDTGQHIVIVYNSEQTSTNPSEIWNFDNKEIGSVAFFRHITKNILAGHVSDYERFYEEYKTFSGQPSEKITPEIKKVSEAILENKDSFSGPISKEELKTYDPVDLANAMINEFEQAYETLETSAFENNYENPADPGEVNLAIYNNILAEYEDSLHAVSVDLNLDSEDPENMHYSAAMGWPLPDDLKYALDDDGVAYDFGDWQNEIEEIFKAAGEDRGIDPDTIDSNDYRQAPVVRFDFYPKIDELNHSDGFRDFLIRISDYDGKHDEVLQLSLQMMEEKGIIRSDESDAALAENASYGKLCESWKGWVKR